MDVIVYPISKGRVNRQERAAAVRCTSECRQKLNDRTSAQKFRRLLIANFEPNDYVVTLTYADATLPATPEQARDQHLKPFIRRIRSDFRSQHMDALKYMYVTEGLHGDQRLHHHIVLPNMPNLKAIVRSQWQRNGLNVDFEKIAARGYDVWASYLTKEPRKTGRRHVGDRMWTPSVGLTKPKVTTYEVEDDNYRFEPPPGVIIEHNEDVRNEWFTCQYISYRLPRYMLDT